MYVIMYKMLIYFPNLQFLLTTTCTAKQLDSYCEIIICLGTKFKLSVDLSESSVDFGI